ncbi:hypothetical protein SAMN05518855_100582 [Paenibacillus sp. CF384]|nr:hypothetical protein SAMN05518855_100582 [Paenibacillus sp. CF384]
MGIVDRIKGLFRQGLQQEAKQGSFESCLESANERLREISVIVNRLESELLSAKERIRGVEKQNLSFRQLAEQAAEQQNHEVVGRYLEQEYSGKERLAVMLGDLRQMEERFTGVKERYLQFAQTIQEASSRHDTILIRSLIATTELETIRVSSTGRVDALLEGKDEEHHVIEARLELARSGQPDALDREIEDLIRSKNK